MVIVDFHCLDRWITELGNHQLQFELPNAVFSFSCELLFENFFFLIFLWLKWTRKGWRWSSQQSPINFIQTTRRHLWGNNRQIKWLLKLSQGHHMHHRDVKQTINGHSPRFLPVNFALNAIVSQSSYSIILRTEAKNKVDLHIIVLILPSNVALMWT